MKRGEQVGRYTMESPLGRGGGGEVWRATDGKLGRSVAVKLLLHHDPEDVARFRREAELAASLKHPGIAALYEFGEAISGPFIAMQLVEGVQLDKARLSIREAARAVRDAALAVQHAHAQGIVHRDLKPQNIMVSFDAGSTAATARPGQDAPWSVMVMDFGLAKRLASKSSLSVSGMAMGTPAYMSPEQAKGRIDVDGRTDVYGLGATLYSLTTGRPPFNNPDVVRLLADISEQDPIRPRKLNPDIPPDLETVILKALEKDPVRRYATAGAFAEDLGRYLDGDPIDARPASMAYVAWKRLKKRPVTAGVVLAMSVLVLAFAGLAVNRYLAALRAESEARAEAAKAERAANDLRIEHERQMARVRAMDALRPAIEALSLWERQRADLPDGDVLAARSAIDKALTIVPDFGPALVEEARFLWRKGAWEQAEAVLGRAQNDPETKADALFMRARLKLIRYCLEVPAPRIIVFDGGGVRVDISGRRKFAAEHSAEREAAFRDLKEFAAVLGKVDDPRVRYAEALATYARATTAEQLVEASQALIDVLASLRIPRWEIYVHLARALFDAERYEEAVDAADNALTAGAHGVLMYNQLGCALWVKGVQDQNKADLERAVEVLGLAVNAGEKYSLPHYNRAMVLRALGRTDEALRDVEAAIAIDGDEAIYHNTKAVLRMDKRDLAGAIADYTRALELEPGNPQFLANRAVAKLQARDIDGAHKDLDEVLRSNPDELAALIQRSAVRLALKDADGAVGDASRAIQINPEHPAAWCYRGNARSELKDYKNAISDWKEFLRLAPRHAMAPQVKANIAEAERRLKEDK